MVIELTITEMTEVSAIVAAHTVELNPQELMTVEFDFDHQPADGADSQHTVVLRPNYDAATLPYYMQAKIAYDASVLVDAAINGLHDSVALIEA